MFRSFPRIVSLAAAALVFVASGFAAEPAPRYFSARPGALEKARARIAAKDATILPAFEALLSKADRALKLAPLSVMDKPKTPDSGDKHDYMSQAPYFWPDPAKPDGLPYIRKDGHHNPEAGGENSDAPRMGRMGDAAETLALAYWFTGKEAYAEHAAQLLRTWFLDPATKMNPNFNFAQAVPGLNTGRGTGMIESRSLIAVTDAAGLLAGSPAWTPADNDALVAWMRTFLDWAQTSKNGKSEAAARNNHGSHYDAQLAHFALFTGQPELAKQIVESAKARRIAVQFKPDGSQPLELAREDSFGYSRFNLLALFDLATVGEHVGVDLWHYQSPTGAGLRAGLDFLMPYVEDPSKPWPYQKESAHVRNVTSLLWQAADVYGDPRYRAALAKCDHYQDEREALFELAK
jgi:hypothetical protein